LICSGVITKIYSHLTKGNFVKRVKYSTEIRECERCFSAVGQGTLEY